MPDKDYGKLADELLPKSDDIDRMWTFGFKDCRAKVIPIVADLLKQIGELIKNRGGKG